MRPATFGARMIQIFVTGGTFDKAYDFISGGLHFKDSHVNEMLERGRCTVPTAVRTLMMVDSLEMTDDDRGVIAHNIAGSPHRQILVTHGTDTMVDTARYLAGRELVGKTVVLTGAMIPYVVGTSSDGFFNLGSAVSFAQALPPGVYVVMNGQAFSHDKVRKNRQTGFFEATQAA